MATLTADVPTQPTGDGLALPAGVTLASPWTRLGAALLEVVLMFVLLGVGWVIWALMVVGHGQTPAKCLLDLRVVDTGSLDPVGFVRMFWVRNIVAGVVAGVVVPLTLGVLLLMPFWDQRNQNLWDKISRTYVVSEPVDTSAPSHDPSSEG